MGEPVDMIRRLPQALARTAEVAHAAGLAEGYRKAIADLRDADRWNRWCEDAGWSARGSAPVLAVAYLEESLEESLASQSPEEALDGQ